MSKYHFIRIFKNETGVTPMQYWDGLRLERGKQLMFYSDLNISQISDKVGYANASYFSRVFKKAEGCSPRDYIHRYSPKTDLTLEQYDDKFEDAD